MDGTGSTSETTNQNGQNIDLERGDGVPAHEPAAKLDVKNEPTAKQDSTSEGAWKRISEKVWEYEKDRIDEWNKQIDTLLVFAGLFSAVLTAFNVQYYVTLQPASGTQIMLRLPSDLTNPVQVTTLSSTSNPAVAATTVVINTLWFLALVLSLSAASVGITVKQWLSSYIPPKTMTSKQRTRLWNHRQRGLSKWRVPAIVSVLPNLLQLALLLFLVGLVVLLWTLNRVSAIVVMIPVTILIILLGITSIIPTFMPECPYKSPQAWWIYLILHHVSRSVTRFVRGIMSTLPSVTRSIKVFVSKLHSVTLPGTLSGTRSLLNSVKSSLVHIKWSHYRRIIMDSLRAFVWTDVIALDWLDRDNNWLKASGIHWDAGDDAVETINMIVAADSVVRDDSFLQDVIVPACNLRGIGLYPSDFGKFLRVFYELVQSRADRFYESVNGTAHIALPMFRDDMDSGLVEAMAEATLCMLKSVNKHNSLRDSFLSDMQKVLSILHALLAVLPNSQPRVFIQLINWYCNDTTTYRPNNAREKDSVEMIARHVNDPQCQTNVRAIPVHQQALLGSRALARLEQLLDGTLSDSYDDPIRRADDLLTLIGMILDNRQTGGQFEPGGVLTLLCCRLGGAIPILSKYIRAILTCHVASIVKAHPFRSIKCIQDLTACFHNITGTQESFDGYTVLRIIYLLEAIAELLDQLQPDDMTELVQPLRSTLVDAQDLTGRTDAFRGWGYGYLHGTLTLYEAMMRKQPHVLSEADLESLEARVADLTKDLDPDEVEELQAKLSSLRQLVAANTSSGDPSASSGADALPAGAEQPAAPV